MKRTPLGRRTPLKRAQTPMGRSKAVRSKRREPRTRSTPKWGRPEWETATMTLWHRSNGLCEKCGEPITTDAERHHRKRRRDGGDSYPNLILVHSGCHAQIHAHPKEARRAGWIVSVSADPSNVPVLIGGKEWASLTNDGQAVVVFPFPVDGDAHLAMSGPPNQ